MEMIAGKEGSYVFLKKDNAVRACFLDNDRYDNCYQVYGTWKNWKLVYINNYVKMIMCKLSIAGMIFFEKN